MDKYRFAPQFTGAKQARQLRCKDTTNVDTPPDINIGINNPDIDIDRGVRGCKLLTLETVYNKEMVLSMNN